MKGARARFLYVLFLVITAELAARGVWWWQSKRHLFGSVKALAYAALYPELETIRSLDIRRDDGFFDVLLLGSSTLTRELGDVPEVLKEAPTYRSKRPVRIHDAAAPAHTSRDDYLKCYELGDKRFDLVIF